MKRQLFLALMALVGLTACGDNAEQSKVDSSVSEVAATTESLKEFKEPASVPVATPGLTPAPLKAEPIGIIKKLAVPYPENWIVAHDAAFFHFLEGKLFVIDPTAETVAEQVKGQISISFIGQFVQGTARPEMYVAETFYTRGTRGTRTDVVTIWSKEDLAPIAEIILPTKRSNTMPQRYALQLINNDKFLLVFNLTPATSVTVIDLDSREVVNEVPIPGCSLIYPTGPSGFSSICSNGGFYTVQLDQKGQVASKERIAPFFDTDKTPLFEKPAIINGIAYFPTFSGNVQPIDLNGTVPAIGELWSLTSDDEKKQGWRPGGWQLNETDDQGRMYILMHPEGYNGSHKDGGPEVWVFDVAKGQRVQRIKLENWGVSLAVTHGANPTMVVTNANMLLDVYDANSGSFQQTLSDIVMETPFVVYGAE